MFSWLKKLLCRHVYKQRGGYSRIQSATGAPRVFYTITDFKCDKCNKIKKVKSKKKS